MRVRDPFRRDSSSLTGEILTILFEKGLGFTVQGVGFGV